MVVTLTVSLLLLRTPARAGNPGPAWQASYDAEARGDLRQSLASLDALPAADPGPHRFHLRRGCLCYGLGAHEDAIASYQAAVAATPAALEPKLGLMLPLLALRRWTDAALVADLVLGDYPSDVELRTGRGWSLQLQGHDAEAAAAYRKVLAVGSGATSANQGPSATGK